MKVCLFGGTFDPPHIGHLHISKTALKKLKLDKLVWVITKQNPLKKKPDLKSLRNCIDTISKIIDIPTLIVLESTTYPSTTKEFILPVLILAKATFLSITVIWFSI